MKKYQICRLKSCFVVKNFCTKVIFFLIFERLFLPFLSKINKFLKISKKNQKVVTTFRFCNYFQSTFCKVTFYQRLSCFFVLHLIKSFTHTIQTIFYHFSEEMFFPRFCTTVDYDHPTKVYKL